MKRVLLVAMLLAVATACGTTGFKVIDPAYTGTQLTPSDTNATEAYNLVAPGPTPLDRVDISSPPTNTGGNLRAVFTPTGQHPSTDVETCATWTGPNGPIDYPQQGLALRVAKTGQTTRAITVTKNIVFGVVTQLNVNLWTVTPGGFTLATPFSFNFEPLLHEGAPEKIVPFPWHVCARTTGSVLEALVWTGTEPRPPYGDPLHSGSYQLPPGWTYPGNHGWYIGHLRPGGTFTYTSLSSTPA